MEKPLEFTNHKDMEQILNIFVEMSQPNLLAMYLASKAETGIEPYYFFNWPGQPKIWGKYRVQKYKNKIIDFLFPTYEYRGNKGVILFAYLCDGNWKKRLRNLTVLEKEFITKLNRLLDANN